MPHPPLEKTDDGTAALEEEQPVVAGGAAAVLAESAHAGASVEGPADEPVANMAGAIDAEGYAFASPPLPHRTSLAAARF